MNNLGYERVEKDSIISNLQEVIIFQEEDGTYQLFNKYRITKLSEFEFNVSAYRSATTNNFYTLKNAVTWCIFDKQNKVYETNRISELDKKLGGIDVDISIHTRLFKKNKDMTTKLIYLSKLTEDKLKKRIITTELYTYILESKRWQIQRFNRKPEQ